MLNLRRDSGRFPDTRIFADEVAKYTVFNELRRVEIPVTHVASQISKYLPNMVNPGGMALALVTRQRRFSHTPLEKAMTMFQPSLIQKWLHRIVLQKQPTRRQTNLSAARTLAVEQLEDRSLLSIYSLAYLIGLNGNADQAPDWLEIESVPLSGANHGSGTGTPSGSMGAGPTPSLPSRQSPQFVRGEGTSGPSLPQDAVDIALLSYPWEDSGQSAAGDAEARSMNFGQPRLDFSAGNSSQGRPGNNAAPAAGTHFNLQGESGVLFELPHAGDGASQQGQNEECDDRNQSNDSPANATGPMDSQAFLPPNAGIGATIFVNPESPVISEDPVQLPPVRVADADNDQVRVTIQIDPGSFQPQPSTAIEVPGLVEFASRRNTRPAIIASLTFSRPLIPALGDFNRERLPDMLPVSPGANGSLRLPVVPLPPEPGATQPGFPGQNSFIGGVSPTVGDFND